MNIFCAHFTVLLNTLSILTLIYIHPSTALTATKTILKDPLHTHITTTRLHSFSSPSENNHLNDQRLSFRNFLTQRSIQSFLSLTHYQLRDPHTSEWIERFVGFPGLLEFHGIGGFDVERWGEWDKVFLELMEGEEESIVLQVKRKGGGQSWNIGGTVGGSKDNPFLKDKYVEYVISIDPTSLARRIMAVREQIADELAEDLNLIVVHNKEIIDSYHANQRVDDDPDNNTKPSQRIVTPVNVLLDNNIALAPRLSSPLRKGNFDLIQILALQESIHRTLRSYSAEAKGEGGSPSPDKDISLEWLREFYFREVEEFFDGSGEWGRADDFINQLLEQMPRVVTLDGGVNGSGEKATGFIVDPSRITEDILEERSRVSMEWKEVAGGVREEHSGLQKTLLTKTWEADVEKEEDEKKVWVADGDEGFE